MLVRELKQEILWEREWNTGKVLSRTGNTMYEVQIEHGLTWTRQPDIQTDCDQSIKGGELIYTANP